MDPETIPTASIIVVPTNQTLGIIQGGLTGRGAGVTFAMAEGGAPAHATVTVNADGTFTFQRSGSYAGPDSLIYTRTEGGVATTYAVDITFAQDTGLTLNGTRGDDVLFSSSGGAAIYGGGGNDVLRLPNGGSGSLFGGSGNDVLRFSKAYGLHVSGGSGNDTYIGSGGGEFRELAGGGIDTFETLAYSTELQANFENLILGGSGPFVAVEGTGNSLGNVITANAATNTLWGKAGDDTLYGGGSFDLLFGGWDDDRLLGGGGADSLDGGSGADRLEGGEGSDFYRIGSGDTVVERADAGRDIVETSASATIAANVEVLRLTGSASLSLTGNASGNVLEGNFGANKLTGQGGADSLTGSAGNDTLYGGSGADVLDAGLGLDRLVGGSGNDIYYAADDDIIVELSGEGVDEVRSSGGGSSYTLASFVENGRIGAESIDYRLTGNGLANRLWIDSAGNGNSLLGGGGGDTLSGNVGYDILDGEAGNDSLYGGDWSDKLCGGLGADRLKGDAGLDDFVYTATSQSTPIARDTIVDFAKGSEAENIVLTAIDANTSATAAGDQAFVLGGAFTAGHIRQTQQGANLLIEGNTDSDSTAELAILLLAVTGALGVEDFAL